MCEVISVYLVSTCMPVSVSESTTYLELVKCISYSISNVCNGVRNTRIELIIIGLEKLDSQCYVYATLMHGCIIARSLANLVEAAKTSLCVASYLECIMCYCLCNGLHICVLPRCVVSALAHCMVVSGCCFGSLWSFVLVSTCSFVLGLMSPCPSLLLLLVPDMLLEVMK